MRTLARTRAPDRSSHCITFEKGLSPWFQPPKSAPTGTEAESTCMYYWGASRRHNRWRMQCHKSSVGSSFV